MYSKVKQFGYAIILLSFIPNVGFSDWAKGIASYSKENYLGALEEFGKISNSDYRAQFWLGKMYLDGHGVPASVTEAKRWFSLAAANPSRQDVRAMHELYLLALKEGNAEQQVFFLQQIITKTEEKRDFEIYPLEYTEALLKYASHLNNQGELQKALKLDIKLQRFITKTGRIDGDSYSYWASTMAAAICQSSDNLSALKRLDEALSKARSCLAIYLRNNELKTDLILIADAKSNLGSILAQLGDFEAAIQHLEDAISVYAKTIDNAGRGFNSPSQQSV